MLDAAAKYPVYRHAVRDAGGHQRSQVVTPVTSGHQWSPVTTSNILSIEPLNQTLATAADTPVPRKLFGQFFFENEFCILFGPTGKGKTILAYQIAESIASGRRIANFDLEVKGLKVLYLDCELSPKQVEGRYALIDPATRYYKDHYVFSENLYRAEINLKDSGGSVGEDFHQQLFRSIAETIAENEIEVLVVDNITWLRGALEKSKDATPLMQELNNLKKKFALSVLVLAHTPKRDTSRPITLNCLAGSAAVSNFADSIFAINASFKGDEVRYLKEIKTRSTSPRFTEDSVVTCSITRNHNFLGFEFGECCPESEHLKTVTDEERQDRKVAILEMHRQGKSQRQIADAVNVSKSYVQKVISMGDHLVTTSDQSDRRDQSDHRVTTLARCIQCGETCHPGDTGICIVCENEANEANGRL